MMHYNLERKLERDLFGYCLLHPRFYEDLSRYVPSNPTYRDAVTALLPNTWAIRAERMWYAAIPPNMLLPDQGFKIHLSATSATAITLLCRCVPIIAQAGATFKFVSDPPMLDYQNSKNFPRGSSGKFVTIYPRNPEECETLLNSLYVATEDLKGPHILSDRPFRASKVVFYRYGGFAVDSQLTLWGERMPMIVGAEGTRVPDVRGVAFQLPAGLTDPFQHGSTDIGVPLLLHGRFAVDSAESFSNSGGVYKGRDVSTGRRVIIKEARPGPCAQSGSHRDATDLLAREYRVLVALQGTGWVPAAIDYFREWDHHFLVEECIEGMPLSTYRALKENALIANRTGTADFVSTFCDRLRLITQHLIDAIEACHQKGVVLGDIAPGNIIIDDKTLALRLIDFEGASFLDEGCDPDGRVMVTPGFASPARMLGAQLSCADDWYSLGAVIYSLILPFQSFFSLYPQSQEPFLREVVKDQLLPAEISDLIRALRDGNVSRARKIVDSDFSFPSAGNKMDEQLSTVTLEATINGITEHILQTKDLARNDRLFPSDYRVFSTNPLSISYGGLGPALYLRSALGAVPGEVCDWLCRQPVTLESYAPGLYVGLAGVSWGLAELGYEESAYRVMNMAYHSSLLYESPDLFYGCAGTGIASLYWWCRTGERFFLDKACELGNHILRKAAKDPEGYYWLNVDGGHHFGYAHGGSGIALFLLYLSHAKQDSRYLEYAIGALDYEIAQAKDENGYLVWSRSKNSEVMLPYWRYGNAGIGSVMIRFYALLKNPRYLALAEKAARYAAGKFGAFPGQFMGLSGIGELFLDMYRFTGDTRYRSEALRIAFGVLLFAVPEPQGTAFPGEELMRLSTDYGTGSAGIGMFLQRLVRPGSRLFHDVMLDDLAVGQESISAPIETERLSLQCVER